MKPARYFRGSALALAAAAIAAFAQPATAQQPYKIGAMLDVTGSASFLGKPEHNAVMLAVEEGNQAGGIRGNKIELVFEDTKSTETDTVLAARKLINQAKVLAIIGPSRTGGAMAAIPVVTEAEVALLCLVSGVGVIQPIAERKWVFAQARVAIFLWPRCSIMPGARDGRSWEFSIPPTPMARTDATTCASSLRAQVYLWTARNRFRPTRPI